MSVRSNIINKLKTSLAPLHIDVLNESGQHNVPSGSETHFRIVIVSDKFNNVNRIQQHRMIHKILEYELNNGVHALSLQTIPSIKWNKEKPEIKQSPKCLGGMKKELNQKKE